MDYNREEQEIDLIDLLFELLMHWRGMIVSMLVVAVLAAGYSFLSSKMSADHTRQQQEMLSQQIEQIQQEGTSSAESVDEDMKETEKLEVQKLLIYEELYAKKQEYYDNSYLLKCDANSMYQVTLTYTVNTTNRTTACDIQQIYGNTIETSALLQQLSDASGVPFTSIGEMVDVSADNPDRGSKIFSVTLTAPNQEMADALTKVTQQYIKNLQKQLRGDGYEHTLDEVCDSQGPVVLDWLVDQQESVQNSILSYESTIASLRDSLSSKSKIWDYYITQGGVSEPIPKVKISLKITLIGAILGIFLYAAVICVQYLMNSTLKRSDDLNQLYRLAALGRVTLPKEGKKLPFQQVDNFILSLRNRNKTLLTETQATELAYTQTALTAKKAGARRVCMVGACLKDETLRICEEIKAKLEQDGFQIEILPDVLYSAQSAEKLDDTEAAVFVETVAGTRYEQMDEELAILNRLGIPALGCITVE